jgi:hypothetical protein
MLEMLLKRPLKMQLHQELELRMLKNVLEYQPRMLRHLRKLQEMLLY